MFLNSVRQSFTSTKPKDHMNLVKLNHRFVNANYMIWIYICEASLEDIIMAEGKVQVRSFYSGCYI